MTSSARNWQSRQHLGRPARAFFLCCVGRCFSVPGLGCGLDLLSCGELKLACMPPLNAPTPHLAAQGSPALDSGRCPPQGLGSAAAGSRYLFHAVCLPLSAHPSRLLVCLMSCLTSSVPPVHLVCAVIVVVFIAHICEQRLKPQKTQALHKSRQGPSPCGAYRLMRKMEIRLIITQISAKLPLREACVLMAFNRRIGLGMLG